MEQKSTNGVTKKVYNLIILDESGSMQSIYLPALTGVNETLQTIRGVGKEQPEQQQYVTLVAFDSEHYNQIYTATPAEKAVDITPEQYRPGGCTPLYDAMGRSINELRAKIGPEEAIVLVTIITDGYENASYEYDGHAIKALVEHMKKQNWVFTYIGANHDVEAVASALAINNHLAFQADEEGTTEMFAKERKARKKFLTKACRMSASNLMNAFECNYFADDDDDDLPSISKS